MPLRVSAVAQTARHLLASRNRLARAALVRDVEPWLRVQFLGAAARCGVVGALREPGTGPEIARRAGLADVDLARALLELGVAVGELSQRGGRYRLRGRRVRAIASGDADDLAGLVEELVAYAAPIYAHLDEHLAGAPAGPYASEAGAVIARASQLVEHVVGPFLAAVATERQPASVLDIGCGTGVNLRWLGQGAPKARLVGLEVDPGALLLATDNVERWGLADRTELHLVDLDQWPDTSAEPFDLVLLAQNVYYWPPEDRAAVLERVRKIVAGGTVVVVSTTPGTLAFGRHLDLVLRVTSGNWRLPTGAELRDDAVAAGFESVRVSLLAPRTGIVALVAEAPDGANGDAAGTPALGNGAG
ncbi:MAG: class I SAM-dependent methyltransferase [Acidimicrobiales bacterium]